MTELFRHILDSTDRPLYLFPHLAFDTPALENLKAALGNDERITILPRELDSDDQRPLMASMEFFVLLPRYHPTIFAIQANLPFLCIKNQFKVVGMLDKIGLGNFPTCWQDESVEVMNPPSTVAGKPGNPCANVWFPPPGPRRASRKKTRHFSNRSWRQVMS